MSEPATHTYKFKDGWGDAMGIFHTSPDGLKLTIHGFGHSNFRDWKIDDYVILPNNDEESLAKGANTTTRYQITAIRNPSNPGDQYFIDTKFAPRS